MDVGRPTILRYLIEADGVIRDDRLQGALAGSEEATQEDWESTRWVNRRTIIVVQRVQELPRTMELQARHNQGAVAAVLDADGEAGGDVPLDASGAQHQSKKDMSCSFLM